VLLATRQSQSLFLSSFRLPRGFEGHSRPDSSTPGNLDFDARVPVPFSIFPSSYRNEDTTETTRVRVEGEANLPQPSSRVGREGDESRYSSFSASLPHRRDRTPVGEEEVKVYEEDRTRRPRREEDVTVYEEDHYRKDHFPEVELSRERYVSFFLPLYTRIVQHPSDPCAHHPLFPKSPIFLEHRLLTLRPLLSYREPGYQRFTETKVDIEAPRREEEIDITERDYRRRVQPTYDVEYERRSTHPHEEREIKVEAETTVDPPSKMGYYDDEGRHHSFRHGLERAADRVFHPFHPHGHRTEREEVIIDEEDRGPSRIREGVRESVRYVERHGGPHTITIPCHHIRVGDLLVLQGRPCQVIRITTSAQTGQHRYLGVDLFTKQLHEESSFVSNPSPSVIVQNMLGPVFKQYRVLDIRDDGRVVAMTETGDVKQGLPVIDQGGLWSRLNESFANGRGSVRVLVINDGGRELAVDYKVIHGSRL